MKLTRRNRSLSLAHNLLGERFPMKLGFRILPQRWHNAPLHGKRNAHGGTITPYKDHVESNVFVSWFLDDGPYLKRMYRGWVSTRRVRSKHSPRGRLNRLRNIHGSVF
jgi:hypothetical protein